MNVMKRLFAGVLVTAVLYLSAVSSLSAAFSAGQDIVIGTVDKTSSSVITDGLTYDDAYMTDTEGNSQYFQMLSFDPRTSGLVPMVYTKYSGYGATTYDSAVAAEKLGYDVKAAVNCSFFGLTSTSCNTYGGVNISDGRILQGSDSHPEEWVMAFLSDGKAELVRSKVKYSVSHVGKSWTESVDCVNMCPDDHTYDVIYYYDDLCGTKTDVKTAGVEVVFERLDRTELAVGRPLMGKVAEVREVSSGGTIGDGQFVLYAPDGSYYAQRLREFSVGDTCEVTAEETVESSRSVMERCSSAFVTYGYHIVDGGKNVTSTDGLGESYNNRRGQKTGIGIKADGTMVIVTTNGREEEYPGFTVYEMADLLIKQGCVTGVNLDGGYSAQMVVEGENGSLEAKTPMSRRVANSLLIVSRKVPEKMVSDLDAAIADAYSYLATFYLTDDGEVLKEIIKRAHDVKSDPLSMSVDYRRLTFELYAEMSEEKCIGYRKGVYEILLPTNIRTGADRSHVVTGVIDAGTKVTVTRVIGSYGYTRYLGTYGWIELSGCTGVYGADKEAAEIIAPETVYKNEDVKIGWTAIDGAAGYSYVVSEINGFPGEQDEEQNSVVIAEGQCVKITGITIPASSRTEGKYLKVTVITEYSDVNLQSTAYIATSALPFRDIERTHWGYDAAVNTYEKGYFSGVTAEAFSPNGNMTRAMMATVIYRMAGSPEITAGGTTFADVKSDSWYYNGVVWCQSQGIVTGITESTFDPDGLVTREMAACFLQRYAKYLGYDVDSSDNASVYGYTDVTDISYFATEAMAWCVENGILKGSGDRLNPLMTADRIQIATVIYNFDTIRAQ